MRQTLLIADAFGRVVHRLREERGIPLEDFGPLKCTTLSRLEHGEGTVYLETIVRIAKRLRLPASELMRLTELERDAGDG